MRETTKKQMAESIRGFHLPRFDELPDVGYYLEQTVLYINQCIAPLGCAPITSSMISNYVKQNVISAPVKKQYDKEQIAYLIVTAIMKNVLSIEHISKLFCMQKGVYTVQVAYDYFCSELENMLFFIYGVSDTVEEIGVTNTDLKAMLRGVIISVSHMIHLSMRFQAIEIEDDV